MPLSEDEQRILQEIEQQFYEHDPALAGEIGSTTLYKHAGRNLKWAALGFFAAVWAVQGARRARRSAPVATSVTRRP